MEMIFLRKDLIDFGKEIKYFNRENNYFEKFLIFLGEYNSLLTTGIIVINILMFLLNLTPTKTFSQDFKDLLYISLLNLIYILFFKNVSTTSNI